MSCYSCCCDSSVLSFARSGRQLCKLRTMSHHLVPLEFNNNVVFTPQVIFRMATATDGKPGIHPKFLLFTQFTNILVPFIIAAELLDFSHKLGEEIPIRAVAVCTFRLDNDTFMGFPILHEVKFALPDANSAVQYKLARLTYLYRALTYRGSTVRLFARLPINDKFHFLRIGVNLPVDIAAIGLDPTELSVFSELAYFFPTPDHHHHRNKTHH